MDTVPRGQAVIRKLPTLLLTIALALASLLPADGAAAAEEEEARGIDWSDWIPSIGPGFGIYTRDIEATARGATNVVQCTGDQSFPLLPECAPLRGLLLTPSTFNFQFASGSNPQTVNCEPAATNPFRVPQGADWCGPFDGPSDDTLDGGAPSFHGQLLGPALPVLGRPRLLFQGGLALPFSSRVVTQAGLKPADFVQNANEPRLRIELQADPQEFWWAGAGVAFQLPIERYTVRAKIGVQYMQESLDISGSIAQALRAGVTCFLQDSGANNLNACDTKLVYTQPMGTIVRPGVLPPPPAPIVTADGRVLEDNLPVARTETVVGSYSQSESLTIRNVTPSLGLEADLARFGPVVLGVSGDLFLSVALDDVQSSFGFNAPGLQRNVGGAFAPSGPAAFSLEGDPLHIFGVVSMRFSWVGF